MLKFAPRVHCTNIFVHSLLLLKHTFVSITLLQETIVMLVLSFNPVCLTCPPQGYPLYFNFYFICQMFFLYGQFLTEKINRKNNLKSL